MVLLYDIDFGIGNTQQLPFATIYSSYQASPVFLYNKQLNHIDVAF